jgi:hypothetical protein
MRSGVAIITTETGITWINPEHVVKIIENRHLQYCDITMSTGEIIRVTDDYKNTTIHILNEMNLC